jgi:hypothetical protein
MLQAWLLASLSLSLPRTTARPDDGAWKLAELHDPFPESGRPPPLPPEEELKLPDLKPLPVERDR